MVRWLHAELPRRLSRPGDSLDAMYALFALAEQQLQRSQASGEASSSADRSCCCAVDCLAWACGILGSCQGECCPWCCVAEA